MYTCICVSFEFIVVFFLIAVVCVANKLTFNLYKFALLMHASSF